TASAKERNHGRSSGNFLPGAGRLADLHTAELGRADRPTARLAVDREDRGEARAAGRAVGAQLAAALRARGRQVVLRLVEVPLREAAGQAHGGPVAEDLAPLLPQPVLSLSHTS